MRPYSLLHGACVSERVRYQGPRLPSNAYLEELLDRVVFGDEDEDWMWPAEWMVAAANNLEG